MNKNYAFTPLILVALTLLTADACEKKKPPYIGPKAETEMDWAIDQYGTKVARSRGLRMIHGGDPSSPNKFLFTLSFKGDKKLTLDEGRVLAADMVEDFWDMLQDDPVQKKYVRTRRKEVLDYPEGLPIDRVRLKISFWDMNGERYSSPYLAEIIFTNSTFNYFETAPNSKKRTLVFKEPYDKAIEFRNSSKQDADY
jgi:hypothetical protein